MTDIHPTDCSCADCFRAAIDRAVQNLTGNRPIVATVEELGHLVRAQRLGDRPLRFARGL